MVRGITVPADGARPIEAQEFARLRDYRAAVGGGIEPVDIPELSVTIYVNETGLLQGLPFNSRVTFLWWWHVPPARQRAMLVGDAVLVGLPNRRGRHRHLPAGVSELFTADARFAVASKLPEDRTWGRTTQVYDYCDATVWAMLLVERSGGQLEVRLTRTA